MPGGNIGRPSLNALPANDSVPPIIQVSYSTYANTTASEKFLPAPILVASPAINFAAVAAQKAVAAPAGNFLASPSNTANIPPRFERRAAIRIRLNHSSQSSRLSALFHLTKPDGLCARIMSSSTNSRFSTSLSWRILLARTGSAETSPCPSPRMTKRFMRVVRLIQNRQVLAGQSSAIHRL